MPGKRHYNNDRVGVGAGARLEVLESRVPGGGTRGDRQGAGSRSACSSQ
jgi:hypothetical protein